MAWLGDATVRLVLAGLIIVGVMAFSIVLSRHWLPPGRRAARPLALYVWVCSRCGKRVEHYTLETREPNLCPCLDYPKSWAAAGVSTWTLERVGREE